MEFGHIVESHVDVDHLNLTDLEKFYIIYPSLFPLA